MIGVNVAIIVDGQVLLTQREDFEVWCLPGGGVDPGESIAQAALREAREETGLEVALTRLVGIYFRPGQDRLGGHVFLFAAHPVGGQLRPQAGETIDLRFFAEQNLPADLVPVAPRRIRDALKGAGGSVAWCHNRLWSLDPGISSPDLYAMQSRSDLPRRDFYQQYLGQPGPGGDVLEVAPRPSDPVSRPAYPFPVPVFGAGQAAGLPDIGANMAVIQDGKILLTLRTDFHVWCLPGGGVEPGESLAHTAWRETCEETGLDVRPQRLVGVYSEPRCFYRGLHVPVFTGAIAGGELHPQAEEVIEARFFGPDELPADFMFGHRQRVLDAFNGVGGSLSWTQRAAWPFPVEMTRQQIYALRDQSGLARREFYWHHFQPMQPGDETDDLAEILLYNYF
jgi:ADP-ribose pyrophosphatase YjhB (NUDIX family)